MVIYQVIDYYWFGLRAWILARGGQFEHSIQPSVLLLHCIVGPYVFILYMMFRLNTGDDNDDIKLSRHTLTSVMTCVGYVCCITRGIIQGSHYILVLKFKDFQGPGSCIFKDQFSTEVYSMDSITATCNIHFCDYGTVLVDKNKMWQLLANLVSGKTPV